MIKLLGALLLITGGGVLGVGLTEPLSRRSRALNELLAGLSLLEQELELGGLPLGPMLEKLSRQTSGTAQDLFAACGRELQSLDREGFPRLWDKLVSEHRELGEEGVQLLSSLGNSLGRCGTEEQTRAIALVRDRLEELRKRTDDQKPARKRLCRALGLSGGAFAAVLLL